MIAEKVARMGWELLSHPSFSPDSTHQHAATKKIHTGKLQDDFCLPFSVIFRLQPSVASLLFSPLHLWMPWHMALNTTSQVETSVNVTLHI